MKDQVNIFHHEKNEIIKDSNDLRRVKLTKSKSDPKYIALINLSLQNNKL